MTTKTIGVAATVGAVAALALASTVSAQCVNPALVCFSSDNYAYETAYNNATYSSSTGSIATIVGRVNLFAYPLDFLNANMPGKEYTFVIKLTTQAPGTVITNGGRRWDTDYASNAQPGTLTVYEDPTPDAPTTTAGLTASPPNVQVPSVYDNIGGTEGSIVLSGPITYFHTGVNQLNTTPIRFSSSFNATYQVTGGTWGYLFDPTAPRTVGAGWCTIGTLQGQCTLPAGYSVLVFGKTDSPPVPTLRSTWGAIKTLYR